ncbi:PfkB family carbohydrate kinase [Halopiger goleimassiliensis]|uniref:PfkB family carbohydrate kinase n=1 Tax=Halopiger goleimassiliensis TaxID=1293048 RepID=UPI0006778E95|nr:PfkB family carbohydrate kinase [Halopiger goleimassiliensis]
MAYDDLADRLSSHDTPTRVVCLPDGSVDSYYGALESSGDRIETRETFGERIAHGASASVPIECDSREPGGQAPNMARQVHHLGADVTLYGHLEDPVFADLPFETHSMGEPASVRVFPFADDDLLLVEQSADVRSWTLADLERAAATDGREALAAHAVCCGNWASIDGLTDALATLADGPLEGGVFVLDPGPVRRRSAADLEDLLSVLGDLATRTEVVYSVNRTELAATLEAVGGDGASLQDSGERGDLEALSAVRAAADVDAAVLHDTERAAVATLDDERAVRNLPVEDPRRRTGAGDCFSAGLAFARARGWEWDPTLALGNCCAVASVEYGQPADRETVRTLLERADAR